ncbi:decarboxylating 6-phosphogluconate dehydrogenase [Tumebacillus sp. DT12]|uniref:Decarboxylating 6-phosphogluconate dehydrogenase n=1 Tax=Tumebacillus lacus TaxID=2995335 RepID=A0ABT3WZ30_9BACL|nr:decarboxylating 6-phosphogluconate dehydrogenase [Tumebacillus lacus]MCX7569919.1 decarboxylating 6-phosphogluconate dehydrogenase [Tumebacillus lacus]
MADKRQIGMIGLGKMGYNLVLNLLDNGHSAVAFDVNENAVKELAEKGANPAFSIKELAEQLTAPRIVWVMVPAGDIVENVLEELSGILETGDIVIEGGNSHYKDSLRRAEKMNARGIHYFDVGTSGGMEGARHGGCFMIGGDKDVFAHIEPVFADISVEKGYLYAGANGSGHFLKMVHNGIEYGMMQAIAEGYEVLEKSQFDYNYEDVSRVWANGSVIRGWLMDLTERAFSKDAKLSGIKGVMQSSGEGKWTVETALELQASAPVIAMSLFMRYRSLEDDTFHGKVVAALRNEFGGHAVVKKED